VRPSAYSDEIGSAAFYTSTSRSHDVTGFSAPTTYMDNITTRLVARLLPDARLHVYPDGHLGLLTMADDLAALVSAFLG